MYHRFPLMTLVAFCACLSLVFGSVMVQTPETEASPESSSDDSRSDDFGAGWTDIEVKGKVGEELTVEWDAFTNSTVQASSYLSLGIVLPDGLSYTLSNNNRHVTITGTPTEPTDAYRTISIYNVSMSTIATVGVHVDVTTDTIVFDPNADGAVCTTIELTADSSGRITLPSATLYHHHILGWFTHPTGGTNVGMPGQLYEPSHVGTLYAHWEDNGSVVIPEPSVPYNRDNGDTFRHQVEYELPYDEESTGATFTLINGYVLDDLITINEKTGLLSGNLVNVVPGTYTLIVQVQKTGYDDGIQYVHLTIDPYEYDEISEFLVVDQEFRHTFNMNPSDSYIDGVRIYVDGDTPYDGVEPIITNKLTLSLTFDEADTYWVYVDITSNGTDFCTQPYVFYVSEESPTPDEQPNLTDIQWSRNPTMEGGYFIWAVNPVYYDTITWSFGDGSPTVSGETSIIHQFESQGHWSITCTLKNLNNGKTFSKTVYIDPILDDNIEVAYINVPYDFTFYDAPTKELTFSTDPEQDWLEMYPYEVDGKVYVRVFGTCYDGTKEGQTFTYTISDGADYNKVVTVSIQQDPETAELKFTANVSGFVVTVVNQGDARGIGKMLVDWNGDGNTDGRPSDFSQFTHDYSKDFGAGMYTIILSVEYANTTIPIELEVTVPSGSSGTEYGSVVYHPNGGIGEMSSQSGKQVTVGDCTFTNGDKEFLAWCTSANGQGTVYMPGDIVYPTEGRNIDLYALWAADDVDETDWLPIVATIIVLAIIAVIIVARMVL